MIRDFRVEDISSVVSLLDALRSMTPYRCIKPDWPTITNTLCAAASRPGGKVLVAEHDGVITGVLVAVAQTLWWQDEKRGARVVSDLIFYSKRMGDGRRLLSKMIEWAFEVPRVVRVECGISSGQNIDRLERLYLSCGLVKEGSFFVANHPKYAQALSGGGVPCPES